MKILITNLYLTDFGGSENWCYAVACELLRRGHDVYTYTPEYGKFFTEFEKMGVKKAISGDFDLILENHNVLDRNKFNGFIIHTCHGIIKEERPMLNADINVAVAEHAASKWNLKQIIPNGIDTERFNIKNKPRKEIHKILSMCKSDTANDILKKICRDMDVELEITYGKFIFRIEDKINDSDLVVGVGRSLLDAMSCGRPVVSFDDRFYYKTRMMGYGYITPDKYNKYIKDSFTGNAEQKTLNKLELAKEIFLKYNPEDGERNRQYIIENYNISKTVDEYLKIYNKYKK